MMLARYALPQVRAEWRAINATDCFCDCGRTCDFRGRFRNFASHADCAAFGGYPERNRQPHSGLLLLSPVLRPSSLLGWSLRAVALPLLLTSGGNRQCATKTPRRFFRRGVCSWRLTARSFGDDWMRRRRRRGRARRERQRHPGIPSRRTVFGVELPIGFEIEIGLYRGTGKNQPKLRANADDARFKA